MKRSKNIKFTNKFSFKLVLWFSSLLILFSVVVAILFSYIFVRNTVSVYKNNLENRALRISKILSDRPSQDGPSQGDAIPPPSREIENANNTINQELGRNNFKIEDTFNDKKMNMRLIEDLGMAEVWYVDAKTKEILQGSQNGEQSSISYLKLPPNAEKIISSALNGKTTTTENFNDVLSERSITVATPIFSTSNKNEIEGVVLLHSSIASMNSALKNGLYALLFSFIISLTLGSAALIFLSLTFTKPLNKIIDTTLTLANGDYTVKTGLKQHDEIGFLARATDKLSSKLLKSAEESARFEKMRNDFITNISHELRTPITVIRGSAEALCDGIITEPSMINEFHEQILSDSVHLQNLINDLIDLTKLQNPDFSVNKQDISLSVIINDVIRSMKHIAIKKNINIVTNPDIEFENLEKYHFFGDYQRIRQMIIIVVHNAIKFSYENNNININFFENKNNYTLDIVNKGVGISPENIDKIFDRFHKSEDIKNKEGMGLGLAIAKQIALRHDIEINASSELNLETKFSFIFPKNIQENK